MSSISVPFIHRWYIFSSIPQLNHNSDGLILLRLARKMLQDNDATTNADYTSLNVDEMMDTMYDFVSNCNNEEVSRGLHHYREY